MDITVLNQADMVKHFSMSQAIQACKDALAFYSTGGADIPLRINIDAPLESGQCLYMPGYVPQAEAMGIKIVSVYSKNPDRGLPSVPATMILLDQQTGQVCALLDGTFLTQLRTGAVSGAATDLLAREDSHIFALLGTGGQAESQLEAVLAVRPIRQVRVFSRNLARATEFAARMSAKFDVEIIAVETAAQAIEHADIITAVTTATSPVFDGRLVKPGAHINGVGSYTPAMQELDAYTITHAGKVYVDTLDGVLNESGDLIIPIREGLCDQSVITGELGQLIAGTISGRTDDKEITVFKTTGTAVLDVVTAKRIYTCAVQNNIGTTIAL